MSSFALRLLAFVLLLPLGVVADDELEAANRAYTYGSYDEAATLFQHVIDARGYSAAVCFDLANAQSRGGHTGLAMLNYERARYLAPRDPDIDQNLQAARKKAGLEPNSFRWWQIALRSIDWTSWLAIIGACLVLIFFATVGLAYLPALSARTNIARTAWRTLFRGILFVGIPLCFLMAYVELSIVGFDQRIEGVIVAPKSAILRLSPFESAESRGPIPEGELVTVEKRHNDYLWIEARNHHFGWIRRKDIEPVIAGSFDDKPQ